MIDEGLSNPLTKLIETIAVGIGKLYEPIHIKRMAKARAEEMDIISNAMIKNGDVPIRYDNSGIEISEVNEGDLIERTKSRIMYQEMQKQGNIEAVIGYAASAMDEGTEPSVDPVDKDWTTRFFNYAGDISSEEMKALWGQILAGEVNKPGSFSFRTLECIHNLSAMEANQFVDIAKYILTDGSTYFLSSDTNLLKDNKLNYSTILLLDECGLINSSGTLALNRTLTNGEKLFIYNEKRMLVIEGTKEKVAISWGVYTLTETGKEIYSIVETDCAEGYIENFARKAFDSYKNNIKLTMHNIEKIENNTVDYDEVPIEEL